MFYRKNLLFPELTKHFALFDILVHIFTINLNLIIDAKYSSENVDFLFLC